MPTMKIDDVFRKSDYYFSDNSFIMNAIGRCGHEEIDTYFTRLFGNLRSSDAMERGAVER